MNTLDNLFSKKIEIVEKLKKNAVQLFYKKIFFEHLGPELKKIFDKKKDKVYYKHFYEASQYEYGFFDKEIDLLRAYLLYKKYADRNDYLCMYKMHVIHLCEYAKFHVPFSRVLEKIYLLKCYAYLPSFIEACDLKLFNKIDVKNEILEMIDLEDKNYEKHKIFFQLLDKEKEIYNLTKNDIKLMNAIVSSLFRGIDINLNSLSFSLLKSLVPITNLDYAYYKAKFRTLFLQDEKNIIISDSEIEKLFKEIENKKLYEFYFDYGYYLTYINYNLNQKIFELFKISADKGYLVSNFALYQTGINYYDFYEIMENFDKITILLDCLLDAIIFDKIMINEFILLMGYLIKYSKFSKKIISKYLIYVKEINDYITPIIKKNERQNFKESINEDEIYIFLDKAVIYYFGFKGIEEQNFQKAVKYFNIILDNSDDITLRKNIEFFKFEIILLKNSRKLISNNELIKEKKKLYSFFSENFSKKEIIDYYLLAKDYFEGINNKKDEYIAFKFYESSQKIYFEHIVGCLIKHEIEQFLKSHEDKYEFKLKDEICCICYEEKVNKLFIPCKHCFCSLCANELEKKLKCPVCRRKILLVI